QDSITLVFMQTSNCPKISGSLAASRIPPTLIEGPRISIPLPSALHPRHQAAHYPRDWETPQGFWMDCEGLQPGVKISRSSNGQVSSSVKVRSLKFEWTFRISSIEPG